MINITDDHILLFNKFKKSGIFTEIGWNIKNISKHPICQDLIKLNVIEATQIKNDFQFYRYIKGSKLPRRSKRKSIKIYQLSNNNEYILTTTIKRVIHHKINWTQNLIKVDDYMYTIYYNDKSYNIFIIINNIWYKCKDINFFESCLNNNHFTYKIPLKISLDYLITQK